MKFDNRGFFEKLPRKCKFHYNLTRITPNFENGEWKSRKNQELEEMSKGENIVKWIKGQRISWLGHLERIEEDRIPKKIFTQELEGTRRRGGHRKRWKEEVERDLQVLGVRRWRELVADRKKMEGHYSTGQSPQWAVVPMEEEEEEEVVVVVWVIIRPSL